MSGAGVATSLLSSLSFGAFFYVITMMKPLPIFDVLSIRIVLTLFFVSIVMLVNGEWRVIANAALKIKQTPELLLVLVASALLVGVQQVIFLWAPANGHALDVSLGFFLFPLTMVLSGRVFFGDKLSFWQKLATLCAAVGVLNQVVQAGGLSVLAYRGNCFWLPSLFYPAPPLWY